TLPSSVLPRRPPLPPLFPYTTLFRSVNSSLSQSPPPYQPRPATATSTTRTLKKVVRGRVRLRAVMAVTVPAASPTRVSGSPLRRVSTPVRGREPSGTGGADPD